ncbi:ribonuclease PH [Ponticaulis sp.]|uniref:ribonuclease PH n=1 Tax=Ponticaulis sp. TaxID=2020902 RepID=UPI000B6D8396|nr:ribonuclease PH [Ponticaulis sp.]MAJ09502.1 ribonuclease PH [Ponticaulis sp.]RPG18846.1 MAG: ribonuclease PH [Hyphomonadaceae bacterium TMED125]HBH88670.1 ribonuclease PH [Hyphomonadaceae bacterium]|tara:strand:+ start:5217 stop:5930 length:714 start_codon:yes stop_codon:yes gene_type:complete
MRPSGRQADQLRTISLETNVNAYAEGSCLAKFGNTHVLCTASWEPRVPGWMKGKGEGWVTGEYGMLPRATHTRGRREAAAGKQSGRTQEIQRLIGRSLRAITDLKALGENQITIDCDVIQADGGTRTASITGGYVALALACKYLVKEGVIDTFPLTAQAAAISCGVYKDVPVLDLDYPEDSEGEVDANFVMTSDGNIIEIQGTGEERSFTPDEFAELMRLAQKGCGELFEAQRDAIG